MERHNPLGTGGDMDCLIAMVKYLWKREQAQSATLEERTRERDEAQAGFNRLDALIGEAETGLDALGAMQERLRAAEATLTAAQVLIGKWRQRADDTDDGPPRGLPYAHALRLAERKCAEELEAALGSSPAAQKEIKPLRAVTGSADTNSLLPQRPEGVVRATAPEKALAAIQTIITACYPSARDAVEQVQKVLEDARDRG